MQNQKSMTLTRALSRIKTTDNQLANFPYEEYVKTVLEKDKDENFAKTFKEASKSKYDQYLSLLDENAKLKLAVRKANDQTMVTVSGVAMSISQALIAKEQVKIRRAFLNKLRSSVLDAENKVERALEQIESKAGEFVQNISKGKTQGGLSESELKNALDLGRKSAEKELKRVLIEGFDSKNFIQEETKALDDFESEIDYVLSEINANTTITIDLN